MSLANIKACVWDTFGTVLDWRGSVSRQVAAVAEAKGIPGDWEHFTDLWRGYYLRWTIDIGLGNRQYLSVDYIHRIGLDQLAEEFGLPLTEEEKTSLLRAWRRLDPWPDSVEGLTRLKSRFIVTPLSNADFGMMVDMSKFAGLPWDAIIAAELVSTYKPNPALYRLAPSLLGLRPDEVLMCAAHVLDLKAARQAGLRTAFVARPNEFGEGKNPLYSADLTKAKEDDIGATCITDLVEKLGA